MSPEPVDLKIVWYRSPVEREQMTRLVQKNDLQAWLLTIGTYGSLLLTGTAAWLSWGRLPWYLVVPLFFLHGTLMAFQINALHEYVHKTVFRSRKLNDLFLYISGFLSWTSPVFFWASHREHHKYTLHPPADLEVTLPTPMSLQEWLRIGFINPLGFYHSVRGHLRYSFASMESAWEKHLFPPQETAERAALMRWSRVHLLGHLLILVLSILFQRPQLFLLVTLAPFYGSAFQYLFNNTQHTGLRDQVDDFRMCARSLHINPLVSFYYWHMEYHTEHHMYAAVPCYNLKRLNQAISGDINTRPGLIAALREIGWIRQRQRSDASYQYTTPLPATARPYTEGAGGF